MSSATAPRCPHWYCGKRLLTRAEFAGYWRQGPRDGPFVRLVDFVERYCWCPQ